jgi:hypothetical protein
MMQRLIAATTLIGLLASLIASAQRPDAYIQWPNAYVQPPTDEALAKAMAEDGLGPYIEMDEPRIDFLHVVRLTDAAQWGFSFETPHELLGLTPVTMRATWAAAGERAGRLLIEAPGLKTPCSFGGDILRDRITVTGEAVCGATRTPFLARIVRHIKCKGFDGVWGGRGAPLTIAVSKGGRVTGTYANGGRIVGREGTLSRIEGEWTDSTGAGRFQFALGPSAETFVGSTWTLADPSKTRQWNGTCAGPR